MMSSNKLKEQYRRVLESAFIVTFIMLIFTFYSFRQFEHQSDLPPIPVFTLEAVDVPITRMPKKQPPPPRPSIPVEAEDDDFLDEVPVDLFEAPDLSLSELPPPPADDEPEIFEYIAVSQKPKPVKQVKPIYPDLARKAGVEGTVVVRILIDTKGNVEKAEIFKSIPMLDEAALAAAKQFKFIPGKQRDKNVKVWMAIPFIFRLK
ncbi:energy transducer TonB [Calditrichota bacterium LG25]